MDYNQLNYEWLAYGASYDELLLAAKYVESECDVISIHESITHHYEFYKRFIG